MYTKIISKEMNILLVKSLRFLTFLEAKISNL